MDLTIFFNIKRKCFLALGQVAFIVLGALLCFKPETWTFRNEFFIRIVGAVTLLYFGFIFLLSFKIFFRKIALVITDNGIFDNSNSLSMGFIPWSQVMDICQIQEGSVFMIKISLVDSNFILNKERNFIKKYFLKKQDNKFGSPVIIPMIAINSYVDILERQLKEKFHYSKQNNK